jgi:hypothetical protein
MKNWSEYEPTRKAVDSVRMQYQGFSRTTRIIVIVGAISLLMLAILEGWTAADSYNAQTESLLSNMDQARRAKSELRPAFRDRVMSLGNIRLPQLDLETTEAERNLKATVDRVLSENGAENEQIDMSPGASIGANKLPEIPRGPGRRLTKIGLRVDFDCHQDKTTGIIRDLEADPEVYTISRIQIRRYEDGQEEVRKLVNVTLTIETWALSSSRSGGRG